MKNNKDVDSLSHTTWRCQYHVVFAPKYRRMVIYGQIKKDIGQILRKLCEQKDIEIIEAEACPDHIHMLISFFAEVQHFLRYGISQGKEQPHDFRQTREFKVQVWKSAFLGQRIFCGCKGKQAVQTLRRNAVDSGKCANGVQKVCSRFPTQKRTPNLTI